MRILYMTPNPGLDCLDIHLADADYEPDDIPKHFEDNSQAWKVIGQVRVDLGFHHLIYGPVWLTYAFLQECPGPGVHIIMREEDDEGRY